MSRTVEFGYWDEGSRRIEMQFTLREDENIADIVDKFVDFLQGISYSHLTIRKELRERADEMDEDAKSL